MIWTLQAFTNCMHRYDHVCNMHPNGILRTQKFMHRLIHLCKNNLNPQISQTDHYALRK